MQSTQFGISLREKNHGERKFSAIDAEIGEGVSHSEGKRMTVGVSGVENGSEPERREITKSGDLRLRGGCK